MSKDFSDEFPEGSYLSPANSPSGSMVSSGYAGQVQVQVPVPVPVSYSLPDTQRRFKTIRSPLQASNYEAVHGLIQKLIRGAEEHLLPIEDFGKVKGGWENLLSGNICIGEAHSDISPKKFLIKNMQRFKDEGFNVIFMEHIFTDQGHQKFLDEEVLNPKLIAYLKSLDRGHFNQPITYDAEKYQEEAHNYSFTRVVRDAKECGIRIVALDSKFLYSTEEIKEGYKRCLLFNYQAKSIIEETETEFKERNGKDLKWIALVGRRHLNTYTYQEGGVFGIADVLACQDLLIRDVEKDEEEANIFQQEVKLNTPFDNVLASLVLTADLRDDLSYDRLAKCNAAAQPAPYGPEPKVTNFATSEDGHGNPAAKRLRSDKEQSMSASND